MAKKQFSSDVEQLIKLVTHSIYSNNEIFLRELISNANDAIQKAKIKASQDSDYLWEDYDLKIQIDIDKDKGILTISDNGIGMTSTEVEKNIWTIAKSGTKDFLEKIKKQKDQNQENALIWQFGIGFYSVFMVANKVELETKSNESKTSTLRISEGGWTYEITNGNKENRGTEIRIYINEENKKYLEISEIKSLIKTHSNYIPVPIMIPVEYNKDDKEKSKKPKNKYEQINDMKSIRTKNKSEVKDEEYKEFYQSLSFDYNDFLDKIHVSIEWAINYKTILFLPQKQNPMSQFMKQDEQEYGPKLYIQNVMILEKAKDLLPAWLRFVKWVVETNDLSLNVSREILQNSPVVSKIASSLTKEILKSLSRVKKKDLKKYEEFFENYGQYLKEWVHLDFANKEKIAELLLFYSLDQNKKINLDEYLEKISGDKKIIYYAIWKNINELKSDPNLKIFQEKNIDVLLMDSPLDNWVINALQNFKWVEFKSIKSADLDLEDKDEKEKKKKEVEKTEWKNKDFIASMISVIGKEKLDAVKFIKTHDDVLANFIHKDWEPTAQMEKIYKAMGQDLPAIKRTIALNLNNKLVQNMLNLYKTDSKNTKIKNFINYAYDQAILVDGGELENMHEFIKNVNNLVINK